MIQLAVILSAAFALATGIIALIHGINRINDETQPREAPEPLMTRGAIILLVVMVAAILICLIVVGVTV